MSRRHALTLSELLLMAATIGVLAGIVFPILTHVRERSRERRCLAIVKQIAFAGIQYAERNNDRWPSRNNDRWPSIELPAGMLCPSTQAPYVTRKHTLECARAARYGSKTAIIADGVDHPRDRTRTVGFADGHAELFTPAKFALYRAEFQD